MHLSVGLDLKVSNVTSLDQLMQINVPVSKYSAMIDI